MRVLEATVAGLVVGLVAAVLAVAVDAEVFIVAPLFFMGGFFAWMASGRTSQHYGSGSLRIGKTRSRRRRRY